MQINPVKVSDLPELENLQPDDWPDIIPSFRFYIQSVFCLPIKATIDGVIAGIGCAVRYKGTSWLAHIIVHPAYRNQGLGTKIVSNLLDILDRRAAQPVLLIATHFGEPVYRKFDFVPVGNYTILERKKLLISLPANENLIPYSPVFRNEMLKMDWMITGEDRSSLIEPCFGQSILYVSENELQGFFIKGLGEGPVIAESEQAGLALLNYKYQKSKQNKAGIPENNIEAIEYLKRSGFSEMRNLKRMVRGNPVKWKPEKIYCRIGGNFG